MDVQKIKQTLKERKITYENLSILSGVPLTTIRKIFSGITKAPRIDTIRTIEKALGIVNDTAILTENEIRLINIFKEIPQEKQDFAITLLEMISKNFK